MTGLRKAVLWAAAWAAGAGLSVPAAAPPQLRYVVIVTRHGVRSPTANAARLNQYSAQPWPEWGVSPGYLTAHGRALMTIMGAYYREWLAGAGLLESQGCADQERIYIHADTDQRTLETGRAVAESLLRGCPPAVHSEPEGKRDALFDPIEAGVARPDWEVAAKAVRARLGEHPERFLELHRDAFEKLRFVLAGPGGAAEKPLEFPKEISVTNTGRSVRLNEELSVAATVSENLLLEYSNGMQGQELGWGRLDAETLRRVLELHVAQSDLLRRTPYLARARGSNLLAHVLRSMEQADTGKAVAGALGGPGVKVLIVVGHDTNLANLSGMLGLSWRLPGDQPDDTPPGGALVLSLWRQADTARDVVRTEYVAQTLQQMRAATPLGLAAPPAREELTVAGCEAAAAGGGCAWETFVKALRTAIDERFVALPGGEAERQPAAR